MRLPRNEVLIIATGGQGEPRARSGRIAAGNHELKLVTDDTVIFSSRIIPATSRHRPHHEPAVGPRRADRHRESRAHVHVSGHPGRPELKQMYDWVRPQIVIPVHGEPRHLHEHARFRAGQRRAGAIVQKNGDVIRLAPGEPEEDRRSARRASWCSTATSSFRRRRHDQRARRLGTAA
jgi:ribonuclease J